MRIPPKFAHGFSSSKAEPLQAVLVVSPSVTSLIARPSDRDLPDATGWIFCEDMTLPKMLARHRADRSCAGCHRRFDSVGLAFEGFGPVGERRARDLGGRPVQTAATFPDGKERDGLGGLRAYLRDRRQDDFLDNLCRKLFSYALVRGILISDRKALDEMRARLKADGYAFGSLVEVVVTSPQFLNKRGRDDPPGR